MATSQGTGRPRRGLSPAGAAMLVAVLLFGALVAFWGWRGGLSTGDAQVASPTPPAATATPPTTSGPMGQERRIGRAPGRTSLPAPTTAATVPSPTAVEDTVPAPTAAAPAEIRDEPVHVRITRGAEVLVDAPVAPTGLDERDELNPPSGVVGWYGPPDWATVPGELSSYPGVLAGHTTYGGARDVFYRLGEVRAGDVVSIRYADGAEVVFEADMDALSVPKNDVTDKADAEYAWVWRLPEPGRTVSLFSCDPAQGLDLTGHSVNNWVVQATRTG